LSEKTNPPGFVKFRKAIDYGNAPTNCFDTESQVKALAFKVDKDGVIEARPSVIVDPCQVGVSPLRTLTIFANGFNVPGGLGTGTVTFLPEGNFILIPSGSNDLAFLTQGVVRIGEMQTRGVSAVNTAQTLQVAIDNLNTQLSVNMVASAGTATLVVQGSVDNTNFITCDSIAAALTIAVTYSPSGKMTSAGAGAATSTGLNPLAFRFIKVTAGAAGAGNTTQLDIGAK